MAKNLFTLTVKTTTPADSELLVGGTGSANAYNFTWTKLKEWVSAFGANNITTTGKTSSGIIQVGGTVEENATVKIKGVAAASDPSTSVKGDLSVDDGGGLGFCMGIYDASKAFAVWVQAMDQRDGSSSFYNYIINPIGGNLGLGVSLFGASAAKNLSIANGVAGATTAGQASFYVLDAGTSEMWVQDGGGTATLLSPHAKDAPEWMYDLGDPMLPQIDKEMNHFDGIVRYTNNTRKNKLIEMQFSGEKLPTGDAAKITFIETYDEHNERTGNKLVMDNWDDFQEREYQRSLDLITKYEQDKKDFNPTKEVKEFIQIKPEVYVKVDR